MRYDKLLKRHFDQNLITSEQKSENFADKIIPILGAGPSTKIATLFFEKFMLLPESNGYRFEVNQHSIKHSGGIQASTK